MRNVALVVLGFVLLVVQAALGHVLPLGDFTPILVLPLLIYLGVHDIPLARGAAIAFVLGYFLDSFSGSPMGLQTFVAVTLFLFSRAAGVRLFLQGRLFQMGLTFMAGLLSGGIILALRAIFERRYILDDATLGATALALVGPALATAVAAPLVFSVVRRVDAAATRRRDEGGEPA